MSEDLTRQSPQMPQTQAHLECSTLTGTIRKNLGLCNLLSNGNDAIARKRNYYSEILYIVNIENKNRGVFDA